MISDALKNKIKKQFWSHEILEAAPFYLYGPAESVAHIFRYYPVYFSLALSFFSFGKVGWHCIEKEQEAIAEYLVGRIKRDNKYSARLVSGWLKDSKEFYRLYNKIIKLDFDKCTDKELGDSFRVFYNIFIPLGSRSFVLEGFSFKADVILADMLRGVVKKNDCLDWYERASVILSTTTRESFLQEAESDLVALYKKYPGRSFLRVVDKYLCQYSWLHNNYAGTGSLDRDWVIEQVKEIKNKKLLKFNRAKIVSQKKSILKKINATRGLINLSYAIDDFAYWQDQRKKMIFHVIEVQQRLLVEFGKRWKVSKSLLEYLTPKEFVLWACDNKPVSTKELRLRQKSCCIIVKKGAIELVDKSVAEISKLVTTKYSKVDASQELKGSSANLGKVCGIVKIVLSVEDMNSFKPGSILVSSMTRPDMIPVLKKSKAIVTDDGGITCHAAIISRELNIPCIVGTKVATRLLKDGDEVEVDANKGLVRIIKR